MIKDRVQILSKATNEYYKINTKTRAIIGHKSTPYKDIKIIGANK